ncbi:MAG: hypothetical protein HYR89_10475 [Actinobacteria bacterium]|nr:hypothetical protein [Actinomycetota bacterium]
MIARDALMVDEVEAADSTVSVLRLAHPAHREIAARAVVAGSVALHGFANIYVLTASSDAGASERLNLLCGRSPHAPAWVTTTPERLDTVTDWAVLPEGLDAWEARAVISELVASGPLGLRLPASVGVPDHLVSMHEGVRCVQVMLAGVACSSGGFLSRTLDIAGSDLLAIQPACRVVADQGVIVHEPVHHRLPSVLSFQGVRFDRRNRPLIPIQTHGSLALERMTAVLDRYDLGHVVLPGAQRRLAARLYR